MMQAFQTREHRERLDKIYSLWYNDKSCITTHTNSILTKSADVRFICLITRYKLSGKHLVPCGGAYFVTLLLYHIFVGLSTKKDIFFEKITASDLIGGGFVG